MRELVGPGSAEAAFTTFLGSWREQLAIRVAEVGELVPLIDGLVSTVLAGSHGRGAPWPLSDIDLILIVEPDAGERVRESLDRHRGRLTDHWAGEGWYTGIDAGRLLFTTEEVDAVVRAGAGVGAWLDDTRWFHTVDKAWGGRALGGDSSGRAAALAAWATATRFDPGVVRGRLAHHIDGARVSVTTARLAASEGDAVAATLALWRAVQLAQIAAMERWAERDNSLGRFGTRFARSAAAHGADALARDLDRLAGLDPDALAERWAAVPAWVRLRHDRSIRARLAVGEPVMVAEDRRDTLRVCSRYSLIEVMAEHHPADVWHGIVAPGAIPDRTDRLSQLIDGLPVYAGHEPHRTASTYES